MILGSGSLNLDIIYVVDSFQEVCRRLDLAPGRERSCSRTELAAFMEQLQSMGQRVSVSGGGSAANTVTVLARLGWRSSFLGVMGSDGEGDLVAASMADVDLSHVVRQGHTAVCLVVLGTDQRDRAMLVAPAEGADFPTDDGVLELMAAAGTIHLSSFVTEDGLRFQERLLEGRRDDQVVSLDPGEIYASLPLSRLENLFSKVDLLFITATELEMLFGGPWDGAREALGLLHKGYRGRAAPMPAVVVKDGAKGARCLWSQGELSAPALEVEEVVDTTGAGDTFDAGFLHAILNGAGVERALNVGHRLAALSLMDHGRRWMEQVDWRQLARALQEPGS